MQGFWDKSIDGEGGEKMSNINKNSQKISTNKNSSFNWYASGMHWTNFQDMRSSLIIIVEVLNVLVL